jgi:hypothetical protein
MGGRIIRRPARAALTRKVPLLAELPESQAIGGIAEIYREIRVFSGVPYVSSLQRYLATLPRVLEWAWAALRPAMVSGLLPETAWRLAAGLHLRAAEPVTQTMLRAWGADATGLATIRSIAANFVRVSPVNLLTGACLRLLLTSAAPNGPGYAQRWTPPEMLPPMPGNIDPAALPEEERAVLMRFATEVDGVPFIPALYRQLAHWPALLRWLADELEPRLQAPETDAARAAFQDAARAAAPSIVAGLSAPDDVAPPDEVTAQRVLAAIERYAVTSPEMTLFGQLILDALPDNA